MLLPGRAHCPPSAPGRCWLHCVLGGSCEDKVALRALTFFKTNPAAELVFTSGATHSPGRGTKPDGRVQPSAREEALMFSLYMMYHSTECNRQATCQLAPGAMRGRGGGSQDSDAQRITPHHLRVEQYVAGRKKVSAARTCQ